MSDELKNFVDQVKQVLEKAPPEIRQSAPSIITAAERIVEGINLNQTQIEPLTQLCTHLRAGRPITPDVANSILERCVPNNSVLSENRTEILEALIRPSGSNQNVIEKVEQAMRSTADRLLTISAISSFVFIVFEISHLWNFWESIKEAKNIVESSSNGRKKISGKLKKILEKINEMNALIEKMLGGNPGDRVKVETLMMMEIDAIRSMLHQVEMDIRNLEVDLDNARVHLDSARRSSKSSMVSNLVTGGTTAANALLFTGTASPYLLALNGMLATANIILTGFNVGLYMISTENLENIYKELNEIAKLDEQRQILKESFERGAKTLRDFVKNSRP